MPMRSNLVDATISSHLIKRRILTGGVDVAGNTIESFDAEKTRRNDFG